MFDVVAARVFASRSGEEKWICLSSPTRRLEEIDIMPCHGDAAAAAVKMDISAARLAARIDRSYVSMDHRSY